MEIQIRREDKIHGMLVGELSKKIVADLSLDAKTCKDIYTAGLLHDLGKKRLNQEIINKEGRLNEKELRHIRKHSRLSAIEVKRLGFCQYIVDSILHHHENFNGTGYPDGLKGYDIPFGARILRVADVYSALTADRVYRAKYLPEQALAIMQAEIHNFDPVIFKVLKNIVNRQLVKAYASKV